jgi:type I restriction enzyme S subunit
MEQNIANLKPNPDWASLPLFDRTGWKRVRFGDVVENCAETCDPAEAGMERFVAMEHLEPGSLHVRSWGNVADGTTFTRRCRPGQVLFGKRRAYQRKVAVAEFVAVVSGDIYVLAPKDDRLLPELLPFLCLSERFFQHAVGTSAGSLSPRTNWSSLASFEFDLPPLDQQRRIAEILWAVDKAMQNQSKLQCDLLQYLVAYKAKFFGTQSDSKHQIVRVADIGAKDRQSVQVGPFGGSVSSRHFTQKGVPVIKINNLTEDDRLNLSELVFVSEEHANSLNRYRIQRGDILTAAQATTGRSALADDRIRGALISQHLIRVAVDQTKCVPEYLLEVFSSEWVKRQIHMVKSKTTRDGLNTDDVANFLIPLPSVELQNTFLNTVSEARNAATKSATCEASSSEMLSAFINTVIAS